MGRRAEHAFTFIALFLFTGAVLPLLRMHAGVDLAAADGDPLSQALFAGVYSVLLAIFIFRWRKMTAAIVATRWIWLLIALALMSCLWSDAPALTLRRGVAVAGTTLFGLYFASHYSASRQLWILLLVLGSTAVLSLLFGALTSIGIATGANAGSWRGVFVHKNYLGRMMVMSTALALLLAAGRRRWIALASAALSASLLLLSGSMTALVALVVLMAVAAVVRMLRYRFTLAIPGFLAALLVLGGLAASVLLYTKAAFGLIGRNPTLTGRTELWQVVMIMISHRPWLGYGYSAFWRGLDGASSAVWMALPWHPPHAHNGFLDLSLELGLVGVAVYLAGFLLTTARALALVRKRQSAPALWAVLLLTLILLVNASESAILTRNNILWVLYVSTSLTVWRGSRKPRHRPPVPRRVLRAARRHERVYASRVRRVADGFRSRSLVPPSHQMWGGR